MLMEVFEAISLVGKFFSATCSPTEAVSLLSKAVPGDFGYNFISFDILGPSALGVFKLSYVIDGLVYLETLSAAALV